MALGGDGVGLIGVDGPLRPLGWSWDDVGRGTGRSLADRSDTRVWRVSEVMQAYNH